MVKPPTAGRKRATAKPDIGIVMGSQSDWETMRHAAETLDALGVPFETRIVSPEGDPI